MKYTLLYVDDETSNLHVFKSLFRRDYNVFTASSAKEGIHILKTHKIDVILSDERMPEMTGIELLQYAVHYYPETVRILVTGYGDIDVITNAINKARVVYYIQKPWDEIELTRVIRNTLQLRFLENENFIQKKELITSSLEIVKSENVITSTLQLIEKLNLNHNTVECEKDLLAIKQHLNSYYINKNTWEIFKLRFIAIHPDFFSMLKERHPNLSTTELKYCAYFKMNMTKDQVAVALSVSHEAVKKSRYRIKKKFNIGSKLSLDEYFLQL